MPSATQLQAEIDALSSQILKLSATAVVSYSTSRGSLVKERLQALEDLRDAKEQKLAELNGYAASSGGGTQNLSTFGPRQGGSRPIV